MKSRIRPADSIVIIIFLAFVCICNIILTDYKKLLQPRIEALDKTSSASISANNSDWTNSDWTDEENELAFLANNFILERKEMYKKSNRSYSWPLRGIGYLFERQNVVLVGEIMAKKGKYNVQIHNIKDPIDCSDLLLWVRVNGPEIFAGHAVPVYEQNRFRIGTRRHIRECHWEFNFDATVPGSYNVEAKTLEWNSGQQSKSCGTATNDSSLVQKFPIVKSFLGFKMYRPLEMCCSICSRLAGHCKAWATPIPAFPDSTQPFRAGCELYFDDPSSYAIPYSTMLDELEKVNETKYSAQVDQYPPKLYGLPITDKTMYFLGCGWSFWFTLDFPCIAPDLDDSIYFESNVINITDITASKVVDSNSTLRNKEEKNNGTLQSQPLCHIDSEAFESHGGRWKRYPWPDKDECPNPMEIDKNFGVPISVQMMKHEGNGNPNCWHRDNLSNYGNKCIEMNCGLIEPWSRWKSSLHREEKWYGQWVHKSNCMYSQFTNDQLQQCIDRRKLYGFEIDGRSIAEIMRVYLGQRLQNITTYDNEKYGDGTKVSMTTLALLHICQYPDDVNPLEEKLKDMPDISSSKSEEIYWVSGYFLSSEREVWCTSHRMKEFNLQADKILRPMGYKMINAFDLSAAMTYDTANQADGMHISGPPMKMIITKFFHYICSEQDN